MSQKQMDREQAVQEALWEEPARPDDIERLADSEARKKRDTGVEGPWKLGR